MTKNIQITSLRLFELMQIFKDIDPVTTSVVIFLEDIQETPEDLKKYKFIHFIKLNDIQSAQDIKDMDEFNIKITKLCDFIRKSIVDNKKILVSCDCGISRSPACCAAIKEVFEQDGISIFADEKYKPNKIIYNAIYKELRFTNIEFSKHMDCWFADNKEYTEEEKSKIKTITEILRKYDPENLIVLGAPEDEYLPEATALYNILKSDNILFPETIYEVFNKYFGETEITFKIAIRVADTLKEEFALQPYD